MSIRILTGDCRELLKSLHDESVHCVVTSPPYFGLRSYGIGTENGEIGLEPTPDAFVAELVAVFREVRRVLRSDGVCFLNLGDSYAGGGRGGGADGSKQQTNVGSLLGPKGTFGLKPKDLIGIPWSVAKALQAPYYTGKIKDEGERIWLAAIIDSEGCFFIHKRKAGTSAHSTYQRSDGTEASYQRTADTFGVGLEICNTSKAMIDRVAEIVPGGTFTTQGPEQNGRRKQTIFRWRVAPNETKRLAQELYPHLICKRQQARLIFSCPSSGEPGAAAHQAMMDLHNGVASNVDYPAPPSLFEKGWYLRQDIIWAKNNPMPESVTDRCTKAHEYLFLLTKSATYFYDAEAIAEAAAPASAERYEYAFGGAKAERLTAEEASGPGTRTHPIGERQFNGTRNRRSVWTVATQPFSEAHFATFPPALIEPCILAGCPAKCCAKCGAPWVREVEIERRPTRPGLLQKGAPDRNDGGIPFRPQTTVTTLGFSPSCKCNAATIPGTCLDPFGGAGTTGLVADRLQRNAILIELNPDYAAMAERRIWNDAPLFNEAAE